MNTLEELLYRFPCLKEQREALQRAAELLLESVQAGGKVLTCGNGGSAADAEHIVGELMKEFDCKRPVDAWTAARLREQGEAVQPLLALQGAIPAISLDGAQRAHLGHRKRYGRGHGLCAAGIRLREPRRRAHRAEHERKLQKRDQRRAAGKGDGRCDDLHYRQNGRRARRAGGRDNLPAGNGNL